MNKKRSSGADDFSLEKKFDELQERFERCEAEFDRWLGKVGLSRGVLGDICGRADLLKSPYHRKVFEQYRNKIDDEISSMKAGARGGGNFYSSAPGENLIRV